MSDFLLNSIPHRLPTFSLPGVVFLPSHQGRNPVLFSKVLTGMVFLKEVSPRTDFLDDLTGECLSIHLNSLQKVLHHANDLVAHDEHLCRTDHPHVEIPNIVNEINATERLGQTGEGALDAGLLI